MSTSPSNNGGNNFFCETHMGKTVQSFLPYIFLAMIVHDEMLVNPKFHNLVIQHGIDKANLMSLPWCCFLGDEVMQKVYLHVYREVVLKGAYPQ